MRPPPPPWPHRLLGNHYTLVLYRLIGMPAITVKYGNVITKMRRTPSGATQVTTQKTFPA